MKNTQFEIRINAKTFIYDESTITGRELLKLIGLPHSFDYEILYKHTEKEFEPVQFDEIVDLQNPAIEYFFIKPLPSFIIEVDDEIYPVAQIFMSPKEILTLAGIDTEKFYLKLIQDHKEITYKSDMDYIITLLNKMKFVSCKISSTTVS